MSAELVPIPEPPLTGLDEVVRRQLADARDELENVRESSAGDADLADAYGDLGRLYLAYDLPTPAEACLFNARELAPGDATWPYLLGVLHQEDRRVDEARASFEAARAIDTDDVAVVLRLGQVNLDAAAPEPARVAFEHALELTRGGDGEAAARAGLGKALAALGEHDAAVRELERALEKDPEAASLRYPLALAYRELGRIDDARRQLARRGPGEPGFPDPRMEEVRRLTTGAGIHLLRGNRALGRGDVDAALDEYRRAVDVNPGSAPAHEALATTLARQGDTEGAIRHYAKALEIEPENFLFLHNQGTLLARSGRPGDAVEHFRRALRVVPDDPTVGYKLALNLARLGRLDEARAEYRRLIASEPEDAERPAVGNGDPYDAARFDLSQLLARSGRYREAAELLQVLVAEDPNRSWARLSLAVALEASGNGPGAMAQYRAVVGLESAEPAERVEAHVGLARLQARGRRFAEAASHYGRAIEIEPRHEEARFSHALVLLLAERDAEARQRLEEGVRVLPQSVRLTHLLARVLAASRDAAVRDGARALELVLDLYRREPHSELAETAAMAFAETGRFGDAVEWQRRLVTEAENEGNAARTATVRERLALYQDGRACRAPWLSASP